jgi:iron complex transport system substrate-binding protein
VKTRALGLFVLLGPFVLAAILAACGPGPEGSAAPEEAAPDSTGAAGPTRVATLLPYVADALDRVASNGGAVEVVAAVPAELGATLPEGRIDLGSPHSPSFESLAAARPDVVVGDGRTHAALEEKLRRVTDRLVMVEGVSVDGTFDGLIEVATAAGVEPAMRRLVERSREDLAALRVDRPVTVLPLFGAPGSYMAITDRTWLGDLLSELDFRNLAAELAGRESYPGYVELSEEVLATLDPDVVLLVTHGSPEAVEEDFRRRAEAGGAWAILADRVHRLDAHLFGRNPGLELPEAARALVAAAGEERQGLR